MSVRDGAAGQILMCIMLMQRLRLTDQHHSIADLVWQEDYMVHITWRNRHSHAMTTLYWYPKWEICKVLNASNKG